MRTYTVSGKRKVLKKCKIKIVKCIFLCVVQYVSTAQEV